MNKKLMILIDGQNIYYGCKGFRSDYKYNIEKLVEVLSNLKSDRELIDVRYYGSLKPVDKNKPNDEERFRKQQGFYESLKYKYTTFIKRTKMKETKCRICGKTFLESKEKGVDVSVASDLLLYGLLREYDVAILVSGDSDFAPVIRKLRDRHPSIRVEIAQFRHMVGVDLKQACNEFIELDKLAEKIEL
ncbi:MAG: NYN domain-containing protein [Candidatus Bathyarchaeum sp.]|nr:MAG: NYN domain-containing protein [Candidatus Bathyarchaeum sp.]